MSVILKFNNQIHDTFLHVSPSLYVINNESIYLFIKFIYLLLNIQLKIVKQFQFVPLIKLDGEENVNLTFWCVQNSFLENESAQLNSKIAKHFGLKNGLTVKNLPYFIMK